MLLANVGSIAELIGLNRDSSPCADGLELISTSSRGSLDCDGFAAHQDGDALSSISCARSAF
jgi:hypothetical protein